MFSLVLVLVVCSSVLCIPKHTESKADLASQGQVTDLETMKSDY
jgi:hypothetical protein